MKNKIDLNKLIVDDLLTLFMNMDSCVVEVETLLDNYDEKIRDHIQNNFYSIFSSLKRNEAVSSLALDTDTYELFMFLKGKTPKFQDAIKILKMKEVLC